MSKALPPKKATTKKFVPRSSRMEKEKRVLQVQEWLIEGLPWTMIVNKVMEKAWFTSRRQAERIIKAARELWISGEEDKMINKRKFKIIQLERLKSTMGDEYKSTPQGIRTILAIDQTIIKLESYDRGIKEEREREQEEHLQIMTQQNQSTAQETPSEVDYSLLSDSALQEIVKASRVRKTG